MWLWTFRGIRIWSWCRGLVLCEEATSFLAFFNHQDFFLNWLSLQRRWTPTKSHLMKRHQPQNITAQNVTIHKMSTVTKRQKPQNLTSHKTLSATKRHHLENVSNFTFLQVCKMTYFIYIMIYWIYILYTITSRYGPARINGGRKWYQVFALNCWYLIF